MNFKLAKPCNHKSQLKKTKSLYVFYIHMCIYICTCPTHWFSHLEKSGGYLSQLASHLPDHFSLPYISGFESEFSVTSFDSYQINLNPDIKIWLELWRKVLLGRKVAEIIMTFQTLQRSKFEIFFFLWGLLSDIESRADISMIMWFRELLDFLCIYLREIWCGQFSLKWT